MNKPNKTETHKISRDVEVEIELEWEDTSFDHEFGTQHQGHYQIVSIKHEGLELPLDIFDEKFLDMLVDKYC